jgi:hypothetical protein
VGTVELHVNGVSRVWAFDTAGACSGFQSVAQLPQGLTAPAGAVIQVTPTGGWGTTAWGYLARQ